MNTGKTKIRFYWLIAVLAAFTAGCDDEENPTEKPTLVREVVSINLTRSLNLQTGNYDISISAKGYVNGNGWSNPVLQPYVYIQAPVDGIYDFDFIATPPPPRNETAPIVGILTAEYLYTDAPNGFKGVRIHSANNVVTQLLSESPQLNSQLILDINRVQIFESSDPRSNGSVIGAGGTVNSGGWYNPTLVAYNYFTVPQDGIYDYSFYATPPSDPAIAVISLIETTHFIGPISADVKGIRIHGSKSSVEFVFADPKQSPCNYVSGRRFETAERRNGGVAISTNTGPGYYWYIAFNADGTFSGFQSDSGTSGLYFCDANGFHMTDSGGNQILAVVEIEKERIRTPYINSTFTYYYRVESSQNTSAAPLKQ